jgi:hypothetical protein
MWYVSLFFKAVKKRDGQGMGEIKNVYKIWFESVKERELLKGLVIDGKTRLKWILGK